ncbi:alpha/beta hydrolase [Fictibacillus aquaticus]|uniref:Carbohydrate esterase n=1 Tax=Fictibacillus aquaticus TaxID=2021314 RepID=A0A235FD81_9BACL|nr:alpha/beta hydrolase-fold protein [Fictibacillus aquaticus]OYD59296.1 carbohydrate esterase [Fictibacillus aquaticus]
MIKQFTVNMTPFNRLRTVRVYVPKSYETDTDKRYPVLYMHDGQNLFKDEDASFGVSWGISDYLDIAEIDLIVVGLDCSQEGYQRLDEYGPWVNKDVGKKLIGEDKPFGGEGEEYIDYVTHELKPMIDAKYRTQPDNTLLAGSSMGGLITTYAACKYPLIYKRAASVSSAYWFSQELLESYIQSNDLTAVERFYHDVGTKESSSDISSQDYINSSKAIDELLQKKVSDCRFEIVEGAEHNEAAWRERFPRILDYLMK